MPCTPRLRQCYSGYRHGNQSRSTQVPLSPSAASASVQRHDILFTSGQLVLRLNQISFQAQMFIVTNWILIVLDSFRVARYFSSLSYTECSVGMNQSESSPIRTDALCLADCQGNGIGHVTRCTDVRDTRLRCWHTLECHTSHGCVGPYHTWRSTVEYSYFSRSLRNAFCQRLRRCGWTMVALWLSILCWILTQNWIVVIFIA